MKYKSLKSYTLAVNNLAQKDADEMYKQKPRVFAAVHYDFPESMLDHYMKDGYTPRQVLTKLDEDARWENECEARCS